MTLTMIDPPAQQSISCADCGVCCLRCGAPPGYNLLDPEHIRPEDAERIANMPAEPRLELFSYYLDVGLGTIPDRSRAYLPCLWYDQENRRCRYYEHRPSVCRNFEVGGIDCQTMRAERLADQSHCS